MEKWESVSEWFQGSYLTKWGSLLLSFGANLSTFFLTLAFLIYSPIGGFYCCNFLVLGLFCYLSRQWNVSILKKKVLFDYAVVAFGESECRFQRLSPDFVS